MSGRTPLELTRRHGGGIRLNQGASFILLSSAEAIQLIADIQAMLAETAETTKSVSA
jgi:hypothetical protein